MKVLVLGVVLLATALSAPAQAWGGLSGSLENRFESYGEDRPGSDRREVLGKLDLRIESQGSWWGGYLNPVLRADSMGFAEGSFSGYRNEDRHESYFTIREGWLVLKPREWLEVGAGSKIFWWGVGEEVNPTNFNPRRYLNLVEPEELGIPSVWIRTKMPSGVYLELVGSKSVSSRLPWDEKNRWRPPDLGGVEVTEPIDLPDDNQFAARLGWSGIAGEVAFTYFKGYGDVPCFEMVSLGAIRPECFRMESIGTNLSVDVFGWFGAKAEAAYKNQEGGQDDYVQWLVGADRYLSWVRQSLYVTVQYVRENVTKEGPNPFQGLDLSRSLKDVLMARVEYEYGDWSIALRGAYDIEGEGRYIQPKISYTWNGWWQTSLGYDHLGGPPESFFGKYEGNRRALLEVVLYF